MSLARHRVDGPEDMDEATREQIAAELDGDRRAERWLVARAGGALVAVTALVLVGAGLFR